MNSILVKDFMDLSAVKIHENTPVREAVNILVKLKLSGAPVVNDNNTLVGFVSEQDCIKEMLNDVFFCEDSISVKNVMNPNVKCVSPESSIIEVAELMTKLTPKHYPVVQNGSVLGVISRSHILEALLETSEDCYLHA